MNALPSEILLGEGRTDGPAAASLHGPVLSDKAFERIAAIAYREAGLHIAPAKSAMVRTRLARRLRALKLTSYETYCDLVESPAGVEEVATLVSALTTNVSHFFREEHHFAVLRDKVLPGLRERARSGGRVRIWSAGSSNGQEPYSIAMSLREAGFAPDWDVRILATDIDPQVTAHARAGLYPDRMLTGLSDALREKYLTAVGDAPEPSWKVTPTLRELVTFKQLNLLHDWPMRGHFDAVFCRNVVIYFDAKTQDQLWQRFARVMPENAWLFLGHSERVSERNLAFFDTRGVTTYQRTNVHAR